MTRILYVEDNADLREMMGLLMQDMACEIVLCASGEEALSAWQPGAFDLVLTDVSLPGLSGVDLAGHLLAADPQQWIAFCSGHAISAAPARFGPNVRLMPKPFHIEDLEALVSEIGAARAAP